ncbi:glycerophosphodiester phosphodiesterase [Spirosoma utsteinense]|uniref:Glycerophosphoryl diester phosphodiesterase n=1 Tax=Spirosoma utsteinense TaxID=2585773 RepID=A0ABR6WBS9_9BACT|nr:glycerophosphodiester phosphodiesterase family protein [Spirosoma utsteinense]MBC3784190.1 glycerophosphoryl diester phosphodiesterase [Spirosoma utsteinense]MBC3794024.1 glycerophosphoryl diester phosphodiesterase [Spirosoma utsteinense]
MKKIIALLLVTALSISVTLAQVALPKRGLCAHRGCLDTHPENTLPAFKEAIRLGAQMIEFDIQLTKDNALVIMHDETVDRTTNGTGKVADLTLAQIRQLDAGIKKGQVFAGTAIPTFDEVLAIMPQNVWLNCHLKGGAEVGKAAAMAVVKSGRMHQAFLACEEAAAAGARQVNATILICNAENRYRKDTRQYVEATIAMKANFIQLLRNEGEDRQEVMARLAKNQVRVNYFYAKDPNELPALFDAGVDFVLVNNLEQFIPQAKKLGVKPVRPVF